LCKSLPKQGNKKYCVDVKALLEAGWAISHKDIEVNRNFHHLVGQFLG